MPELPDVELFRQELEKTSLHRRIAQTSIYKDRLVRGSSRQLIQRRLKDQEFQATYRHGKHLLVRISNDGYLVLHFGMTGNLVFRESEEKFPEYTAAIFSFVDGSALTYSSKRLLGRILIVQTIEQLLDEEELGPDALSIPKQKFVELLSGKRGTIKSALMNQSTLSGIGNVYSDEILFQAKLHPKTEVKQLSDQQIGELYEIAQSVLKQAIQSRADPQMMPSGYMLPQRTSDAICPQCQGTLEKQEVSGRGAIYCPHCQAACDSP